MTGSSRGLLRHYRHWRRYREILNILIKNGLSFLVERLDLPGLPVYRRLRKGAVTREEDFLNLPQRLAQVMRELGPTFIKLGQLLSTRPDLLPEEYIQEFAKLQDRVASVPYDQVETVFLKEFGKPLDEVFEWFDKEPVASASIGQVHRAKLRTGQDVVVKVQRPGIERIIRVDLEILAEIGSLIEQKTRLGEVYKISEMIEEFSASIMEELDFTLEGRNADIFKKNFEDNPQVYIPRVYWEHTTRRILVMEYVQGQKITTRQELREAGFNPLQIARCLVDAMIKQVYLDGFFHSDPHPGNLAVLNDNKIVFMDFGQIGQIDEELREKAADLVLALVKHNPDDIIKGLFQIGVIHGQPNLARLRRDLSRLERKYYRLPLCEISLGTSVQELLEVAWRYQIQIPSEFVMAAKAMITLEGVIRELAPEMSLVEIAEPFASRVIWQRYDPRRIRRRFMENIVKTTATIARLPYLAEGVAERINHGQVSLLVEHKGFPMVIGALRKSINRLALSIILASLLVAGAILVSLEPSSIFSRYHLSEIIFVLTLIHSFILTILLVFYSRD